MAERVQKVLARMGLGSRREIERWIEDGRVQINGQVISLGAKIDAKDKVSLDGKPLSIDIESDKVAPKVLIYHKPMGEMCTNNDPEGRDTVFDNLPKPKTGKWIMIGRLDMNTAGLLLFTNDGELANRLMHPSYEVEREYAVRVLGEVDLNILERLTAGVKLDDGMARFEKIEDAGGHGANHWYHVMLKEGRNREVRRLWESQGLTVSRLIRVRYGPIKLPPDLKRGRHTLMPDFLLKQLYQLVGLSTANDSVAEKRQPRQRVSKGRNKTRSRTPRTRKE